MDFYGKFDYPRAPLADTYHEFLSWCKRAGKGPEFFSGKDPRNPWQMMTAGVDEWRTPLQELLTSDGGIQSLPSFFDFEPVSTARVKHRLGSPFLTIDELESLYWKEGRRSATLPETLLACAVMSRESLRGLAFITPTREKLFTSKGEPAVVHIYCDNNAKVVGQLIRREKIEPCFKLMVCPIMPIQKKEGVKEAPKATPKAKEEHRSKEEPQPVDTSLRLGHSEPMTLKRFFSK